MVVVLLAFAALTSYGAVSFVRTRWRLIDTPTSDAAHVFPGLSEVHGVVEAIGAPIIAASDGAPCVWWQYKVESEQRDKDGNSKWVTQESGGTGDPFQVRDASGVVRVVIDDRASISKAETRDVEHLTLAQLRPRARRMYTTYEQGSLSKMFGSNDLDESIADFKGRWRATETRLRVGDEVFISAHARLTPDGGAVELANTDAQGRRCTFEVTVGDERAAMGARASRTAIGLTIVISVALTAVAGRQLGNGRGPAMWLLPSLLAAGAAVMLSIGAWNRVRRARERCHFAWSLIDVACEQRSLTVPQLQTVVGGALAHEQTLLVAVAGARDVGRLPTSAGAAAVLDAEHASQQVIARVEALPSLNTQPNVAQLMEQLTLLNDRVAFARRFYNDSVERLANRVAQFPDSLVARIARVQTMPLIDDLA